MESCPHTIGTKMNSRTLISSLNLSGRSVLRHWRHVSIALSTILIVSSVTSSVTLAQEPSPQEAEIETFFRRLANKSFRPETTFEQLFADGPLNERDEDVKKLIDRFKKLESEYGAYVAAEKVDTKFVGKDLAFHRYLYKAEKYPIVWRFTYYRKPSSETWNVIGVSFDTRLDQLAASLSGG